MNVIYFRIFVKLVDEKYNPKMHKATILWCLFHDLDQY